MQFVHEAIDIVHSSKGILFDLDGVLWLGNRPIPGVAAVLQRLRDEGKKLMFVSNTSSRSKAKCLEVFEKMGVDVDPGEVFIASECAARYIAAQSPGARARCSGGQAWNPSPGDGFVPQRAHAVGVRYHRRYS